MTTPTSPQSHDTSPERIENDHAQLRVKLLRHIVRNQERRTATHLKSPSGEDAASSEEASVSS